MKFQFNGNLELTSGSAIADYNTAHAAIRRATDGSMQLDAPGNITINIDTNDNSTNGKFSITEDAGTQIFAVTEAGGIDVTGHITASGNISASGNLDLTGNANIDGTFDFASTGTFNDDVTVVQGKKIKFDSADTAIYADASDPENLYIEADDDIFVRPDDNFVIAHGTTNYVTFRGDERELEVTGRIDVIGNITASGTISASGRVTTLQVGKDSTDQIDFSTDNTIIFKVGDANEVTLDATHLFPTTDNGQSLGKVGNEWADLFLNAGGVINFNNDMTITHLLAGNNLAIAGGSLSASGDFGVGGNISALTGTGSFGEINLEDNKKIKIGTGDDLQIYHNGSNSYIQDTGTGKLILDTNGTEVRISKTDSEIMANFITDGAVELYHNHVKKFETTALGIDVTGNINTSSHITASGNISASGDIFVGDDLFIADAGVINYNNSEIEIKHSGPKLVISGSGATELQVEGFLDINGDVDIDGGSLTVGNALQLSSGGSFNFGSSFGSGRITWDADYASLFGLANKKG